MINNYYVKEHKPEIIVALFVSIIVLVAQYVGEILSAPSPDLFRMTVKWIFPVAVLALILAAMEESERQRGWLKLFFLSLSILLSMLFFYLLKVSITSSWPVASQIIIIVLLAIFLGASILLLVVRNE